MAKTNIGTIKFDILKKPRIKVENEEKFFKLIKVAFLQKRKTLVNALVNGKIFMDKESAENCLKNLGIDTKIRGEKLTLEQYNEIAKNI